MLLLSAVTKNALVLMCGALDKSVHPLAFIMFMQAVKQHTLERRWSCEAKTKRKMWRG